MAQPTQSEVYALAYKAGLPLAAATDILQRFADLTARVVLLEQALLAAAPTAPPR